MAKRRSKKGGGHAMGGRKRKSNPFRRTRHHRRNPVFGYSSVMELLGALVAGAAGLIADAYLPSLLLGSLGSNMAIYAGEIAVAALPAWLLAKYPNAAKAYVIGAGANIIGHVIDDATGTQYVSVSVNKGGVSSFYMNGQQYVLPSPSVFKGLSPGGGRGLLNATPNASQNITPMGNPGALSAVRYPFAA